MGSMGLIAGEGQLPLLVARGMKAAGHRVCCVAFRGHYEPELPDCCDEFRPVGLYRIGSWSRLLRRWGASEAVMVGRVAKTRMHDPFRLIRELPDWRAALLWYRRLRHDRRDQAVLAAVIDELDRGGIRLMDSTTYIPDQLASTGVMGTVQPTAQQEADIAFAWPLLSQTSQLDIGQSMAVRERDIIAVEAVEGTDRMIKRAGELCRAKGWSLLKTSPADHDRRADVPSIGVSTVHALAEAGGGCIALGTGRVILIDKDAVLHAADEAGIAILGVDAT
jgi:DUF1009 family protein